MWTVFASCLIGALSIHVDCKAQKALYPGVLEYEVNIDNTVIPDSTYYEEAVPWFIDNIEASSRLAFFDLLFEKAREGKIKVCDANGKVVKSDDTKALQDLLLLRRDTVTLTQAYPPYDEFDTIVPIFCTPDQVVALRFREQWSYDTATLAFTKKVLEYGPIFEVPGDLEGEGEYVRTKAPLFWVSCTDQNSGKEYLTRRIIYRVGDGPDIVYPVPLDTNFTKAYMSSVHRKTWSGKIPAFQPVYREIATQQMSDYQVQHTLHLNKEDPITMPKNEPPYDNYDTIIFIQVTQIKEFSFLEEWNFDIASFSLTKKVVGLCPITEDYDWNDETARYIRSVLWMYFYDIWAPYKGKVILQKR
jgi:hypothetical protein